MTNAVMTINNTELPIREYRGKRVVTLSDIDSVHNRREGTASRNFKANRKRFIDGEDYYMVKPADVRIDEFRPSEINNRGTILITETGYLMLVKSFTDNLAWEVQRQLVNGYFRTRDTAVVTITPEIAKELLKHNAGNRKINQAIEIGFEVWDGYMNGWLMKAEICRYGRIANHDHSIYEIEEAIKLMN